MKGPKTVIQYHKAEDLGSAERAVRAEAQEWGCGAGLDLDSLLQLQKVFCN